MLLTIRRIGEPLPPFPKPTHGDPAFGLKPYVYIGDALEPLQRLGDRAISTYHNPHQMPKIHKEPYDPYTEFVGCVTCNGTDRPHPSGERDFTPVELGLLQGLPIHHHLSGSKTEAIKQVGNMFPPTMAELVFRVIAQILEAYDHGLIEADDEIEDLNITLIEKGVDIPELTSNPTSVVDLTAPADVAASPYLYLSRPELSDAPNTPVNMSSPWANRQVDNRDKSQTRQKRAISVSGNEDLPAPQLSGSSIGRPRKRHTNNQQ